jgi:hypothetical protein
MRLHRDESNCTETTLIFWHREKLDCTDTSLILLNVHHPNSNIFSFLQPTKRGLKLFIRCDAKSGYVNEFEVYLGKSSEAASVLGSYCDVVRRLTDKILNAHHEIVFDNAYTSIPLALHLLQNKTYSCGTLRSSRKNVPNCIKVNERQLGRGEFVTAQDTKIPELCATVWRDTKCVRFLSTNCNPRSTVASRRIQGVRQNVQQPSVAQYYGRYMGGVDHFDALRGNVSVGRTSKKSWKYLFYFAVNACMVNAWIIFQSTNPTWKSHTRFRHSVATGLLETFLHQERVAKMHKHKHVKLRERGRLCKAHKVYKPDGKMKFDTKYGCAVCNIHICALCFAKHHANL